MIDSTDRNRGSRGKMGDCPSTHYLVAHTVTQCSVAPGRQVGSGEGLRYSRSLAVGALVLFAARTCMRL